MWTVIRFSLLTTITYDPLSSPIVCSVRAFDTTVEFTPLFQRTLQVHVDVILYSIVKKLM